MAKLFSDDPSVRQVEHAFLKRLVQVGAARAARMGTTKHDDYAESVMNVLDSGVYDEAIADVIESVPCATPVAFKDLKEFDIQEWARSRGIKTRSSPR